MEVSKYTLGLTWKPQFPKFSLFGTKSSSQKSEREPESTILKQDSKLVDGLFVPPNDPKKLKQLARKELKDTTGKSWFDMPAQTITPETKRDLQLLSLRNVMDPKRHYKKGATKLKELPKYFQVGTIIEPASEFYSRRLTKKERKPTLAAEIGSDPNLGNYRKRKVREIEQEKNVVGMEKWKIKNKQSGKRAKHRRGGRD